MIDLELRNQRLQQASIFQRREALDKRGIQVVWGAMQCNVVIISLVAYDVGLAAECVAKSL